MSRPSLLFKVYTQPDGSDPVLGRDPLALDERGDVFRSDIHLSAEGVEISECAGQKYFSISVHWQVPGFGFLFMPADGGGEHYQLPADGRKTLNLSYELLLTRIERNRRRMEIFKQQGGKPSSELRTLAALAVELFEQAAGKRDNPTACAAVSQMGLKYALLAGELIEMEMARFEISLRGPRPDFLFGCDTRAYFQMKKDLFLERFCHLFNFATITHYLKGDSIDFEPRENQKHFKERDQLLAELRNRSIRVEGRPLFWTHTWVTPDWLKKKSFDQVMLYLEKHIKTVMGHYGDQIIVWEVVNELHDWANELQLNHEQTVELTKFACQTARAVNPNVKLLINNCCPYAHYVQLGKWHEKQAKFPQRTPHQFTEQLIDAGVDFDLLGVQVYFVKRSLAETVSYIERYAVFGKQLHLAEIGSPSRGLTQEFNEEDRDFSQEPYEWQRHWDEALQADWLESIFTVGYSKPYIEAANWYDFVDPYGFLKSGGILRSPQGETKAAYHRLKMLQNKWSTL